MGYISSKMTSQVLVVLTTAVVAFLLAQGVMPWAAAALLTEPSTSPNSPGGLRSASGKAIAGKSLAGESLADKSNSARDDVLRRNIFDPTTGSLLGAQTQSLEEEAVAESTEAEELPPGETAACQSTIELVGALVHHRSPAYSSAILRTSSDFASVAVGSAFADHTLVAVHSKKVELQPNSGPRCHVSMFAEKDASRNTTPTPVRTASRPPKPSRSSSGGISDEEYDAGIRKRSDTSYDIDRKLVDKLLSNRSAMMRTARVIPQEENGRVIGVKLWGIRRNSLLARIGITNGDMLRTINGFDMTSPDGALEAYARLRSADKLTVAIVRRGKPITLNYSIR